MATSLPTASPLRDAVRGFSRVVLPALVVAGYAAVGIAGAVLISEFTVVGADLGTYQRAGHEWLTSGDPYRGSEHFNAEYQYRYPPLLAMAMPILGWPPIWYSLIAGSTAATIWLSYRDGGAAGLLLPTLFFGAWLQTLLNGNVQPILILLLALTPRFARVGPICLAVATMLKLHPVLGLVWFVARRDWRGLRWYSGGMLVLLALQAPWLSRFLDYYLNDPAANPDARGISLVGLGLVPWIIVVAGLGVLTYRYAGTRWGWALATLLQLAALPRLFGVNLALLMAAPIRRPPAPRTTT